MAFFHYSYAKCLRILKRFDNTDNSPFYIKDGVNYKYPLYKFAGTGLTSTIGGTQYYKPSNGGVTSKRDHLKEYLKTLLKHQLV